MLELRGEVTYVPSNRLARNAAKACREGRFAPRAGIVDEEFLRREILPRLLEVHARAAAPALPYEIMARTPIDGDDGAACEAFLRLKVASGEDIRELHEVLASTARQLGEWWSQDACDFFAVSQGVARLRAFLASVAAPDCDAALAPLMLMLTPPGETHRFGAEMAADLFRREGWRVERADGDVSALSAKRFDAVSVSCGCERAAAVSLSSFIQEIRVRTGDRRTPVLVGGAFFLGHPARGETLGVEYVASDPDQRRRFSRALLKPRHT